MESIFTKGELYMLCNEAFDLIKVGLNDRMSKLEFDLKYCKGDTYFEKVQNNLDSLSNYKYIFEKMSTLYKIMYLKDEIKSISKNISSNTELLNNKEYEKKFDNIKECIEEEQKQLDKYNERYNETLEKLKEYSKEVMMMKDASKGI